MYTLLKPYAEQGEYSQFKDVSFSMSREDFARNYQIAVLFGDSDYSLLETKYGDMEK